MIPTVYFISGLGADKRAFQFLDLSFCNPVFVEWIEPFHRETIGDYAVRLKEQITDKNPVIVGLSFGGMVAAEIARRFPVRKLILLSSAKTEKEIPFYIRWLRYVPIHKITPLSTLKSANHFAYRLMGIANRADKIIFQEMLKDSNDTFMRWAINQVVHWRNNRVNPDAIHIHGTADIILPHRYVHAHKTVAGGEHLMLMIQPVTIAEILKEIINEIK